MAILKMKRIILLFFIAATSFSLTGQTVVVFENYSTVNSLTGYWDGYNVSRNQPTLYTFRNNSITSVNSGGYMIQAGDEAPSSTNNNLNGEQILGNKFIWNGTDIASTITHGVFLGYNINSLVQYNYLYRVPTGIVLKSNGMTFTSGGVAYNIINKTGNIGVVVKGINGINIYNNTFYSDEVKWTSNSVPGTSYGLVDIFANDGLSPWVYSTGTKIKNNIFYTVNQICNINIENSQDLTGFESDYNIFYCESGTPMFKYLGVEKTFAQWQALGFDTHSRVMNPNFLNLTDFVPSVRLDYGTDLGSTWQQGLATNAVWNLGSSPSTASQNGGTWQVGARVYSTQVIPVSAISVTGEGGSSSISTDKGHLQLSASVSPANATNKAVTWSITNGTGQATISAGGLVTAISNGDVTAKALASDGSGVFGTITLTLSNQIVPVTGISVTGAGGASTIATDNGSLQLTASISPSNATNKNVAWSITSGNAFATISPDGNVTAIDNGSVTATATATDGTGVTGSLTIIISKQVIPVVSISLYGAGGSSAISTDKGTLQITETVLPSNATDKSVSWSVINGTGQASVSMTGLVTAIANGDVTIRAVSNDGTNISATIVITITNQLTKVSGITVAGTGGASTISTDDGTLQLIENVLPADATDKSVTWSIANGSGLATISTTGLLTALDNGTVTVKATAKDGSNVYGTIAITISNQIILVTGITVTGAGGLSSISTDDGFLQLTALVLPSNATNKSVTWQVVNGTGQAIISPSGLVTAVNNGTVTATATATDGTVLSGSISISITNQIIPVTAISVSGDGGSTTISADNGTLQMSALVLPLDATNKSVIWSVTNMTGQASISPTGLLTAADNGTVSVKATAADGSNISGSLVITLTNQVVPVTGITVTGTGGASIITTPGGTLQMNAAILPLNATDKTVNWSVTNGTGTASIDAAGLLTSLTDGTVTVLATAHDGSGITGSRLITISTSIIPVSGITVTGAGGLTVIDTNNGTLALTAAVLPLNASDPSVVWSIVNGTGKGTVSVAGLLTATANGTVIVTATAVDGSGVSGSIEITISNQVVLVTGITVTGSAGESIIATDNGTLQLIADVLPADATNKTVSWSVLNGTGRAIISSSGLVTAVSNGTVTASASSTDGTSVTGTLTITNSNQIVPVSSISVTGAGGSSAISTDKGTLQLSAAVSPSYSSDNSVTWSIVNGTGQATINSTGLVTAVRNGSVTARATANDGSGVSGTLAITITNQIVPVTGIIVTGTGGISSISTDNGTLQLHAGVLPADATDNSVVWSIVSGAGLATINSSGLLTAQANGNITALAAAHDGSGVYGTLVVTISNQIIPVSGISVQGTGGLSVINTDDGTLQLIAQVSPSNASNTNVTWSISNGTGQATISAAGRVTAAANGTVTATATAADGSGVTGSLTITLTNQVILLSSVSLSASGGVTSISTDNGQLQVNASILPSNATNTSLTWSVTNVTGRATINSSGLVTAVDNGTVTVRATSNDGSGVYGTLTITISNQVVTITSISVSGTGGSSIITTNHGSLQMIVDILPSNASNKTVTWSVSNGTGQATISASGMLTAVSNGTVTATATANDGSGIYGSLTVNIFNQISYVTSITVSGTGGVSTITTNNGSLQLLANILPSGATDKSVTWSLLNGTGKATINPQGIVTALDNGTVTAKATANDGSLISGSLVITISNQSGPVTSITITATGGANTIAADNGTLQLTANVLPANATVKTVTWSFVNNSGIATINSSGLVMAESNGVITARATANDGSGVFSLYTITISNQVVPVTEISVTGAGGSNSISTDGGSLQLTATVIPAFADNKTVTWSVINGTGQATVTQGGLVTAVSDGIVTVLATANDGSGIYGSIVLTLNNQIVQVKGIIVTGENGNTAIDTYHGTLQLSASVLPVNATNSTVTWSVINGTGKAAISTGGLVSAIDDGTVTAVATADDGSQTYGSLDILISGQIISVSDINIYGKNGESSINENNKKLQLNADILPSNATNKTVTWSLISGIGLATVNATGLVTAIDNGKVIVKATANDGSGTYGLMEIPISIENTDLISIIVSRDEIKIQLNQNYISWKISLYDFQGNLVYSKLVESDLTVINISQMPSGLFIVALSKGKFIRVAKAIKP